LDRHSRIETRVDENDLVWVENSGFQPLRYITVRFYTEYFSPAELWWNLVLEYKVFLNADY